MWPPTSNPYHYKAFRLKINQVGKYPTSWSLKKLPKTGVHALSSLCRTTSLLVSKESDGRISYKSREKEDSLSLKMGEQTFYISFSFLPLHVFLSFVLFVPFCFSFLSHFSSHLSFTFSSFSLLLCHSLPFSMSIDRMGQKEAISSSFPQVSCVTINFPSFFFFFSLFPFYDIINHMAQYGPWNQISHMANCEPWNSCHPCGSM